MLIYQGFKESPYVTDITPENFLFQLICEFTGYIEQIEAELQKIFQNKCVDLPVQLVNISEVVNGSGTAFKIAMNPISIPRSEQSPQGYIENAFHTEALAHQTPQNADWIQRDIEFTNINSGSVPWTAFQSNLFPLGTTESYLQQIDPNLHFIEPSLSAAVVEEEEFLTKISNLVEKYGIKHYFRYVCSIPTPHPQHQFTVIDRFGFGFISSANDLVTAELMIRDLYRH